MRAGIVLFAIETDARENFCEDEVLPFHDVREADSCVKQIPCFPSDYLSASRLG
jgi:hypothetical protein